MRLLVYINLDFPGIDGDGQTWWPVPGDKWFWIEPSSERDLRRAPSLERFIRIDSDDRTKELDFASLSLSQYLLHRLHVRLIRSYTNGGDTVMHMRQLEWRQTVFVSTRREGQHKCDAEPCSEHFWMDVTCFNGTFVPFNTLRRMYEILGETLEWTQTGRELELPEGAWRLLRVERDQQGE